MTYIAEIHRDNLTTSRQDHNREAAYHSALGGPCEWAIGCDEADDRINCEASISDFLKRDV